MRYRKQIWDSVARDYDVIWEVPDYTPILQSIIEEVRVSLNMKVLDVATGTGIVGLEVAKKVGEQGLVLCIDISKLMLKQAVKKTKALRCYNTEFILADAHNLPLPDEYFDAVTSCFTFAFLTSPQKAANEMARVLKTGGRMASVEWERPPLGFWAETRKKAGIYDFRKSELIQILHDSGLRKIRAKRIQVLHRRPNVSEELVKKAQILSTAIMGLKENDAEGFFSKIREEYQKIPHEKRHGWLPTLYVGTKY